MLHKCQSVNHSPFLKNSIRVALLSADFCLCMHSGMFLPLFVSFYYPSSPTDYGRNYHILSKNSEGLFAFLISKNMIQIQHTFTHILSILFLSFPFKKKPTFLGVVNHISVVKRPNIFWTKCWNSGHSAS